MNTNKPLDLTTKQMDVNAYLTETYPHLGDELVIEQRDCGFGNWSLFGTVTYFDEGRRIILLNPRQTHVKRLLHRRLSTAYYPTADFDWQTDDLFTPVKWRGRWSDYERSSVFDLLQQRDPALYPLDKYPKWYMKHAPGGNYRAWRNLFQRHAARSFDGFLSELTKHFERSLP